MATAITPTDDAKTRAYKGQQNTFGLLPGIKGSCPGATTGTGGCWHLKAGRKTHTCYVDNLMNFRPNIKGVLKRNFDLLRNATYIRMVDLLDQEFHRFWKSEERRAGRTGEPERLWYRIHWSGDFFSLRYARAMRAAIKLNPHINFWVYTRNFKVVPLLKDLPNLILYLSLDQCNAQKGLRVYHENGGPANPNLRFAYMSEVNDFQVPAQKIAKSLDLTGKCAVWLKEALRVCPVDIGKLPKEQGCMTCGRCLSDQKQPVWFAS